MKKPQKSTITFKINSEGKVLVTNVSGAGEDCKALTADIKKLLKKSDW